MTKNNEKLMVLMQVVNEELKVAKDSYDIDTVIGLTPTEMRHLQFYTEESFFKGTIAHLQVPCSRLTRLLSSYGAVVDCKKQAEIKTDAWGSYKSYAQ